MDLSNHPLRPRQAGVRAFTLVELLVVIGIIALLISILLPSLSKARDSATTVKCLANLKSIGQAFQVYASDNKGYAVPAGWQNGPYGGPWGSNEHWENILVIGGYITAPNSQGKPNPETQSAFFCPGGATDRIATLVADTVPVSRVDQDGAGCMRSPSLVLAPGTAVDCWYGINASTGRGDVGSVPLLRCPADGDEGNPPSNTTNNYRSMTKLALVPRSSEMVMIFDGLFMNHMGVNANRINARHNRQSFTNLLFFDGHAQSYPTKLLPGGLPVAKTTDFAVANLNTNYPPPAPRWRINQD